ncbi:cell wall hydrolase [Defluviicoccus vanus]|uniref:Cell wall hydrolase n=1 Tax=Defluviicoccus vanus TaxID=111831 RepID=A0A7H1N240_9PROT|nr:cell wall hydrolase [Defluviicoccus vanus]QNT69776.1 cell wall hydrolase [Defluviicoccus vanus]
MSVDKNIVVGSLFPYCTAGHLPQSRPDASINSDKQPDEPAMPRRPVRDIVAAASLTLSIAACASPDGTQSWNDATTASYGAAAGSYYGMGAPELTWEDRDALGRVAFAEAGNQGDLGIAAVVYTIFNRVNSGQFQSTVQDVIDAPNQFEPCMRAGGWRNLRPLSASQDAVFANILDQILSGALPDPTNGALFFQNARIVAARAARGKGSASLVDFGGTPPVAEIGDHRFYDWRAAINLAAARSRSSGGYSSPEVADLNSRSADGSYSAVSSYSSQEVADLNAQQFRGSSGYYASAASSYADPEVDYSSQEVTDLNERSLVRLLNENQ